MMRARLLSLFDEASGMIARTEPGWGIKRTAFKIKTNYNLGHDWSIARTSTFVLPINRPLADFTVTLFRPGDRLVIGAAVDVRANYYRAKVVKYW